jgi:hypothetical protein
MMEVTLQFLGDQQLLLQKAVNIACVGVRMAFHVP